MGSRDCELCGKTVVLLGRDKLLHEDEFCYIVENGNSDGYAQRISLIPWAHRNGNPATEYNAACRLRDYMTAVLRIPLEGFLIRKTMRTYPEHFHIHAYVLPIGRR